MKRLVIQNNHGKGRTFEAILLAYVRADALWQGGQSKVEDIRPVWAMFTGTDSELRAFVANLQIGHKATTPSHQNYSRHKGVCYELLKSAGYQYTWQRTRAGSIVTAFLPDLFRLDPGMVDPVGIRFCVLPSLDWVQKQKMDSTAPILHVRQLGCKLSDEQLQDLLPVSALFAAYLDRRTHCPLVADFRFYLQILWAALDCGVASMTLPEDGRYSWNTQEWGQNSALSYIEVGTREVGLLPGVACKTSHEGLEMFLAGQVARYFGAIKNTGCA